MNIQTRQNGADLARPNRTIKLRAECFKCNYWCEYEVDANWRTTFEQKKPTWYIAHGHTGLAACYDCGTIYCEPHSARRDTMKCPQCGSTGARYALWELLLSGNY